MNEHIHPIFKRILDQAINDLAGYVSHREEKCRRKLSPRYVPNKVLRDLRLIQGGKLPRGVPPEEDDGGVYY